MDGLQYEHLFARLGTVRTPITGSRSSRIITYILSLKTEPITSGANAGKYDLRYVASPVCVYWNPYNVELRVPDQQVGDEILSGTGAYHGWTVLPGRHFQQGGRSEIR